MCMFWGHFLLAVQPWPACADLATQTDRYAHIHIRTYTHTRPVLTYTSFQTATPPWRASVMCLHYVPRRILSSPPVQLIVLFILEHNRGSKDGSSQNRCFVLHRKHTFFVIVTQTDLAVVQSLNRGLHISHLKICIKNIKNQPAS